jgi:hypothetical protein
MKITLCGSMKLAKLMEDTKKRLEERGHTVKMPELLMKDKDGKPMSIRDYWEKYGGKEFAHGHELWNKKSEAIWSHFKRVEWCDAILVLNEQKDDVTNYIGGNTLIEMGVAFYLKKPIYLLNPIPEVSYKEEILGMKPVVLNGNLDSIK